jgi:hypothetical protein
MRVLSLLVAMSMVLAGSAVADDRTPIEQVEQLLKVGLAHAKDILEGGAEFDPYAYVARSNGSTDRVGGENRFGGGNTPGGEEIGPEAAIEGIVKQLVDERESRGDLVTIGIFADTEIKLPKLGTTSAVQARMEHESGYCTDVYYPYSRLDEGELVFGHAVSTHNDGAVFGNCK